MSMVIQSSFVLRRKGMGHGAWGMKHGAEISPCSLHSAPSFLFVSHVIHSHSVVIR